MEFKTVTELRDIADIRSAGPTLTRTERLDRWAKVLRSRRRVSTLHGTEFKSPAERDRMRADNSPLSVAYQDLSLRIGGLADDTYGEAKRYFELSDDEMHAVVCDCHFGGSASANLVARRLQRIAHPKPGVMAWLAAFF